MIFQVYNFGISRDPGSFAVYGYNKYFTDKDRSAAIRQILLSPLTQPTEKLPLYLYEDDKLTVFPNTIQADVTISYLKTPNPINWTFTTGAQGQYVYNPADPAAQNFELDITEQNEIILRVLAYAGIIIQDPTIIQSAASAVATEDTNEKQ